MRINRRQFLQTTSAAGFTLAAGLLPAWGDWSGQIDRRALIRRHNPLATQFDPFAALTVGNGEFAFTADVTGLQTFSAECEKQFPLCTTSHWAWHSTPLSAGLAPKKFRYQDFDTYGRPVGYATDSTGQELLFNWLRENPHRFHLGQIGFALKKSDGSPAVPGDLKNIHQTLDLWNGLLESYFEFEGRPVQVQTCCHPELDLIAAHIESPLLADGRLLVRLAFPCASPAMSMADWGHPERHTTTLSRPAKNCADFARNLDATEYTVRLQWNDDAELARRGEHEFLLGIKNGHTLEFACHFSPKPFPEKLPGVAQTQSAAEKHWRQFWNGGGAIDLSGSTDPRAPELERRIVLSLYNTALHCTGALPSAETGLLCNSWFGKFHLEMHWWHSVHFTAWNRFKLFEQSLAIYERILPLARDTARRQGYRGARWPKMIGPDGHDSPSSIGPLLIWQQPHPIYYAELSYRQRPDKQTLARWREIVFESAEFMASYAEFVQKQNQFVLGPPLKTVSENTDALTTANPTFELAYWRFGLRVAQSWRERLGLARETRWDQVLKNLSPLPVQDGVYLMQEGMTDTYTKWNWEHPALLGTLGMQPGDGVDADTMRRTVQRVRETWQWDRSWGWDFPMAAMAATRTGQPELALDFLLLDAPKNRYLSNGHNYQRADLPAYLPGNGGLLAATAMMCAGWTGGPNGSEPGFPKDGKWSVRWENLKQWM
ncbi:MAG TPA: twin-arginine translocation signal domain-containing protein [Candidatus Limnocylindrales bacterium]|nr:twin-arginine translocation signal domain-containing protein [Candidatus Limnocylindrales bacterium]